METYHFPFDISLNGSLQWGHGIIAVETASTRTTSPRPSCFNGATASSPWKRSRSATSLRPRGRLQWGHGIIAVETVDDCVVGCLGHQLQWGHGIIAVETSKSTNMRRVSGCFNGATASSPWKHGNVICLVPSIKASMGPRHHRRGNERIEGKIDKLILLQWGHGIIAVETDRTGGRYPDLY